MPALEKLMAIVGRRMTFTPPARAKVDSLFRRLWQARWTATSDEEQAVSSARLGPRRLRT